MNDRVDHEQQACKKPKSKVWLKRGWTVFKWATRLLRALWFVFNFIEGGGE